LKDVAAAILIERRKTKFCRRPKPKNLFQDFQEGEEMTNLNFFTNFGSSSIPKNHPHDCPLKIKGLI
jgi:hypothetical protein